MIRFFQHSLLILRIRYLNKWISIVRNFRYEASGMKIGKGTFLPKVYITWPHQVSIGKNCIFEHLVYFKFDGVWCDGPSIILKDNVFIGSCCEFNIKKKIIIGHNTLIGSGTRLIDHDHGIDLGELIGKQLCLEKEIIIGEDVWVGCNVVILKGVHIGDGAVIAAGAVVTKSIPPLEIWGGVPAKKISNRKK